MIILDESATELGPIEEAQIEKVYERLSGLQLELDEDPLSQGPKKLNEKIAVCRAQLSECERIFAHLSQILHRYRRNQRVASADYKLRLQDMLTNDVEVRGGRASTDREAIAATKLKAQINRIEVLTGAVQDLEAVMVVVKAKREDLKDIQRRLKEQQTMCREEINLGARWGTPSRAVKRAPLQGAEGSAPTEPVADELNAMMDRVLAQPGSVPVEEGGELSPLGFGSDAEFDSLLAQAEPELKPAPRATPFSGAELDPDLLSSL